MAAGWKFALERGGDRRLARRYGLRILSSVYLMLVTYGRNVGPLCERSDMGTIIDYLDWYGDLDFGAVAFNEVDALVLTQMSYLDMEGIGADGERGVSVSEASRRYFGSHTTEEIYSVQSLETPLTPFLLQGMAAGRRFSRCRLSRYVSRRDASLQCQFAAVCVETSDEGVFVAFRGTDDTLVGWREDFKMGCGRVPVQEHALEYLSRAAEAYPGRLLYVAGHSKGGNLAVYASAMCAPQVQGRIVRVYDFDGPGFIAPVLSEKRLAAVRKRVTRIVPGYCVIGALFHRARPDLIVKSDGSGLAQHSAFNWQVKGPGFETLPQREKGSARFARVFGTWMDGIPLEERTAHVNEAFDALESTGVATMSEIARLDPLSPRKLIVAIGSLPPATRQVVDALILALLGNTLEGLASPFAGLTEPEADGGPQDRSLPGEGRRNHGRRRSHRAEPPGPVARLWLWGVHGGQGCHRPGIALGAARSVLRDVASGAA